MCMHTHPCRHACMHECRHMLSSNRLGGTSCWKAGCEYTSWSSLTHACPIHVSMHTVARCSTRLPFWAWACVAMIYKYLYVGYVGALSDTSANICVRKRCVTCRGRSCEFDATGACIGTCTRKKLMLRHTCAYMYDVLGEALDEHAWWKHGCTHSCLESCPLFAAAFTHACFLI